MCVLPLIRKDHWTFRVFEFPRAQKWVLCLLLLAFGCFLMYNQSTQWLIITNIGLLICLIHLSYLIWPYTPFASTEVDRVKKEADINFMVANVYQFNTQYNRLLKLVEKQKPDIIMLVETDKNWEKGLSALDATYKHKIKQVQDNTYGILIYSKLPVHQDQVRFLVEDDIPSIRCMLDVNGRSVVLYSIHPEPPSPTESEYSTPRDTELKHIAKECAGQDEPILVAGDLNDVAWSYTTTDFLETSGLRDPRKGRGIFPTFHAANPLVRFPLDHIFISEHFNITYIKRLPKFGSDHFPMAIGLVLKDD